MPLEEYARNVFAILCCATGATASSFPASGYPGLQIYQADFIGEKFPHCKDGELVVKKGSHHGNIFYGSRIIRIANIRQAYEPISQDMSELRQPVPAGETFEIGLDADLSE